MPSTNIRLTVTGADANTPLRRIQQLARLPLVEIGLLLSGTPEGRNRYPCVSWLNEAASAADGSAALHVCGSVARRWLQDGGIERLTSNVARIQVNGKVGMEGISVPDIERLCARYPGHVIITQHCSGNEALLQVTATNHALLVDASGGRGIGPAVWERPDTLKAVGFAGGLGPDNLVEQLPLIAAAAAGRPGWVDMEGKIRDADDWFDADRARACIRAFHEWQAAAACT